MKQILVIQRLTALDASTSKSSFWQNIAMYLMSVVREKQMHIILSTFEKQLFVGVFSNVCLKVGSNLMTFTSCSYGE